MDVVHTQVCLSIEQDVIVAAIIVTDNLSALFPNASAKRNDKLFRSRLRSEYVQSPVARIQWSAFKETNFRILNNRLSYSYILTVEVKKWVNNIYCIITNKCRCYCLLLCELYVHLQDEAREIICEINCERDNAWTLLMQKFSMSEKDF